MDKKFKKLRISRIFHNSCKSRDDVAPCHDSLEKSPFLSRSPSIPPEPKPSTPPKPLPRPSICKPRTPPSLHINNTCIISSKEVWNSAPLTRKNRASTPKSKSKTLVAPFSHFAYNPFYDRGGSRYSAVKDYRRKNKKSKSKALLVSDDHDFFSSDDEREDDDERTADTLFSSRSLSSSESSENRRRAMRRNKANRQRTGGEGVGVRGSFAVVKKSRDPYGDFRTSMVEMIIERQIFGEKELQKLLLCFLSLNSSHHHNIIVEVFNEIWDALFCM